MSNLGSIINCPQSWEGRCIKKQISNQKVSNEPLAAKSLLFLVRFGGEKKTQRTFKGISWRSVKLPNVVIKTIRLENYQQYNSLAGSQTKTNHTQDLCSAQIRRARRAKTPQKEPKNPAAIIHTSATTGHPGRTHGAPTFDIRGDIIPCWWNINMSAIAQQEVRHRLRAICSEWEAITEDGGASQALLAPGAPTASHSHMEAFFLPQSCPVGFHKSGDHHIHRSWDFIQYLL